MADKLKIVLEITSSYFEDETIPKPLLPFDTSGGKFVYEFESKEQLTEYTGKLYAQYAKFENPQTGLIAELLAQIANQLPNKK